MPIATTVTFHGTDPSDALRTHVIERAARLERFASDIQSCHVVVERAERRHQHGNRFRVRGSLLMRGRQINVSRAPSALVRNTDPYVAVTDVFDALRRRVEDYVRRRRNDVKTRT